MPLRQIVCSLAGWLAAWLAGWLAGGDVGWWMVRGDMEAETESPTHSSLEELGGYGVDLSPCS